MAESEGLALQSDSAMNTPEQPGRPRSITPETDAARWKQLDELLDAVLDVPLDRRSAFLDRVCAGDDVLRREIGQLLTIAERARSFIESPAFEPSNPEINTSHLASLLTGTAQPPALLQSGKLIAGRYEILSR